MSDIIDEMNEFTALYAPEFNPTPFQDANNRWLARSAMQKAIRRGQVDRALVVAGKLLLYDADAAWRALATIIVEDVGPLEYDILAYSCLLTMKTVRQKLKDPTKMFAAMIDLACHSTKTRACCELSLGAEIAEKKNFGIMHHWDEKSLMNAMLSPNMVEGYVAACVLRKKLRGLGEEALHPALEMIRDQFVNQNVARAAMLSFERTVDSMNLAVFPWLLWIERDKPAFDVMTEQAHWPESIEIGTVASEAYDMHTMQGKKAIKALATTLRKTHKWVEEIKDEDVVKALGSMIFIVEGGCLDFRMMNEGAARLKLYQDTNFAKGWGMPAHLVDDQEMFTALLTQFRHSFIPILNQKRKWACGHS